jgi:hypothetical protein
MNWFMVVILLSWISLFAQIDDENQAAEPVLFFRESFVDDFPEHEVQSVSSAPIFRPRSAAA